MNGPPAHSRRDLRSPPTLWHAFDLTVQKHARKAAIVRGDESTTFGYLWDQSRQWSNVLAQHGVTRGDRVLLWDGGSETFASVVFGVWTLGAIPVPLDPQFAPAHVDHAVGLVEPRVVVRSGEAGFPARGGILPIIDAKDVLQGRHPGSSGAGPGPLPTEPALIVFTSGSTGRPKAVVHLHGALLRCHQRLAEFCNQRTSDRSLCPLPWAYTFALRELWTSALVGTTIILPEARTSAGICDAVSRHRPTFFAAIPQTYAALLRGLAPLRHVDLSSVRGVMSSGSAMPSALLADLMECFANAQIFLGYGLTESQRSTILDPALVRQHPTSVGRPLPGVEIAIVDECGRPVAPGELGEVVHRGDQLCAGYWRDPETTARLLRPDPLSPAECASRPSALFSGDVGFVDDEGHLFLKGRHDRLLKPLGVRVSPQEIEELLDRSGLVRDVGVVGRPHDTLGDEICAAVVPLEASADFRTRLLKYARETMSPYMFPRQVIVKDALPRIGGGKIDYQAISSEFARLSRNPSQQPDMPPFRISKPPQG